MERFSEITNVHDSEKAINFLTYLHDALDIAGSVRSFV